MRIPFKWLCEWLPSESPLQLSRIIRALEQLGIEIESVSEPTAQNKGLIAARIDQSAPFSHQSQLAIAEIFDGSRHHRVLSKAVNCRAGAMTVFAPIGSRLANGMQIEKRAFGSVSSDGMLCGWEEIGLMPGIPDLIELPPAFKPGESVADWLADPILELGITPNLGHCLSVRGVAREVARLLHITWREPALPGDVATQTGPDSQLRVVIEANACSALSWCQVVWKQGAQLKTPIWLAKRLWQCGLRSIDLIVDATNYAMLEMGQPMHAYALDALEGELRFAQEHQPHRFLALDGREILTAEGDIVAVTESGHIASLGGVIGSAATAVHAGSRGALIESAHFPPTSIQRASRRLGLLTEAAKRMERGVDPMQTAHSLERVRDILASEEIASSQIVRHLDPSLEQKPILCRMRTVERLLGLELNSHELQELLSRCSLQPQPASGGWWCTAPSYRFDLLCEVDLIAEIARIKGLDALPRRQSSWSKTRLEHDRDLVFQKRLRERCRQLGYAEIFSQSLIGDKWLKSAGEETLWSHFKEPLFVKKPKSADHQYLRTGLLASFLPVLLLNRQRGVERARIFEVARIYCKDVFEKPREQAALGLLSSGPYHRAHWSECDRVGGFYEMKGQIENLLQSLYIQECAFLKTDHPRFHPGRAAIVQKESQSIGIFGQLHPALLTQMGLGKDEVFFCQLSPKILLPLSDRPFSMQPFSNFPSSQRDWTLTLAENLSYRQVRDLIPSRDLLISVKLLGIYRSERLGIDRKNFTLRFSYRSNHQTLSQADVDQEHSGITRVLQERLGAHLLDANLTP